MYIYMKFTCMKNLNVVNNIFLTILLTHAQTTTNTHTHTKLKNTLLNITLFMMRFLLAFYCCVMNQHTCSMLEQLPFPISQFCRSEVLGESNEFPASQG